MGNTGERGLAHVSPLLVLACLTASAFGGPAESVSAAAADVAGRAALERPLLRYLYLGHLDTPKERMEWWHRIASHAAGTSRKARIFRPAVILLPAKPGGPLEEADGLFIRKEDWGRAILVRLNLSHQGYERDVWERIALVEPHYHFREREVDKAKIEIQGEAPVVVVPVPETVEEVPAIEGVQFYREIGGNRLQEIGRDELRPGETVLVKKVRGGSLESVKVPAKTVKREAAKREQKEEAKKQEKTLHGEWSGKDIVALALATNSDSPIAYADFYWWQTSIQTEREPGPGYSDLLGIKDEKTFDERVGFDGKLFKEKYSEFVKEYRAAMAVSGISKQPRRIAVEDKLGGEKWFTFDNIIAKGKRNPIDTPNGGFRYDASEQMAHLPNGFLAMGLFAENGTRQDSAPDTVVGPDRTSTNPGDGRIHAGKCFGCHANGLQPVSDYFSKMYKGVDIGGPDYKRIEDLQEKYFGKLQLRLKQSIERHAVAVKESCGLTLVEYSKLQTSGWYEVEDRHVDLKRAAREFGVTPQRLQAAIRAYRAKGRLNAASILDMFGKDEKDQEPVPVRQFWECIPEGHAALAFSK